MLEGNQLKSAHGRKQRHFSKLLLNWRKNNNFDSLYPWRNSKSKYNILLSEVLLKKTTRRQVAQEWKTIISCCKNFEELQKCSSRTLKKILRPLGLEHTRSKHLKELSKKITAEFNGKVPGTREELLSLPGVGPYTANAVLCFAYKKDVSMIDANILRVLTRVFDLKSKNSRPHQDKEIWKFAESLPTKGKGKEFNYGILDFAAQVCTSKNPMCRTCVMKKICDYYSESI